MLTRLGPLPRFLLGLAGFLSLLALTAAIWFRLHPWPYATLPPPGDDCKLLRVCENGKFLLAVHDRHLAVWDLDRRREVARCPFKWVDNEPALEVFWFSADGLKVAFMDDTVQTGQVCLWNRELQGAPIRLPDCWRILDTLLGSATLVTWGKGGYQLWDPATGKEILLPAGRRVHIRSIQHLAARGMLIAFEKYRDEGWLVNPSRLTVWTDLTGQDKALVVPGAEMPAEVSPDGRLLAVTYGHRTCLYDLATGRLLAELPFPDGGWTVSPQEFSPDSRLLVTTSERYTGKGELTLTEGKPVIWDVSAMPPRKLAALEVPEVVAPPMFSPDGRWAALWQRSITFAQDSAFNWGCQLFDTQAWQPCGAVPPELAHKPTFAPDSRTIASKTTGMDEPTLVDRWLRPTRGAVPFPAVKVWEVPTGREIAMFRGGICFAYLADGQHIAVATEDGSIELWDIPPRRPWWVEFGLPVVFVLLVLLGVRFVWRAFRLAAPPHVEPAA